MDSRAYFEFNFWDSLFVDGVSCASAILNASVLPCSLLEVDLEVDDLEVNGPGEIKFCTGEIKVGTEDTVLKIT